MKTHIWMSRSDYDPLVWYARCGRIVPNATHSASVDDATCDRCIRARRDVALRTVAHEGEIAHQLTMRLESNRTKRARRLHK